jgi:hypothetical protein
MYQATASAPSIDPIISRLRPRSIGEILDQAFRLYRRHFLTFIAIIAVVHVPLQLALHLATAFLVGGLQNDILNGDLSSGSFTTSRTNDLFTYLGIIEAVTIVLTLIYALLQQLSQAALTTEVANSHLDKPVSFRDGYRQMFSRLGPVLGVIFLQLGIVIAIFLPVIALLALTFTATISSVLSQSSNDSGIFPLFCFSCLLIIPTSALLAYVYIRISLVTPVVMVESLGPVQTIRRSWELVRNYWWRTFALFLLLAVLGYVVQAGPTALIQAIVGIFVPRDFVVQQVVSGVVSVFTTLVYIPIQLIAMTLYYFDLRVRKEGYDIETALTQRYTMPPSPYPAWAGAGYGQPTQTTPVMQPPALGQDYYGYNYNQGAPTQPVTSQAPEPTVDGGPSTVGDDQATADDSVKRE